MPSKKETVGEILYTEKQIRRRAAELGRQITRDYKGEELVLLGTLKGAIMWMSDLMREIDLDTEIDFICAGSYGSSTTTTGVVKVTKDVDMDLYNKNVLIVEDIVDTGTTLNFLKTYLGDRNPRSIRICTLLDKPARRRVDLRPDYIGFTIDDMFIVGYGMDYDQKYRNLPYISYLAN